MVLMEEKFFFVLPLFFALTHPLNYFTEKFFGNQHFFPPKNRRNLLRFFDKQNDVFQQFRKSTPKILKVDFINIDYLTFKKSQYTKEIQRKTKFSFDRVPVVSTGKICRYQLPQTRNCIIKNLKEEDFYFIEHPITREFSY